MRPIIYPYNMSSGSARALRNVLRPLRSKLVRSNGRYRTYNNHLIINWGNPLMPIWSTNANWINFPHFVSFAGNKLLAFLELRKDTSIHIPEFTTDINVARQWASEGVIVVCRTLLRANGGRGIVLAHNPDEVVRAPLYTKYFKKKYEFRIHVFRGEVIDVQCKLRNRDNHSPNYYVRNRAGGWIFSRNVIQCPQEVKDQAVLAVRQLGLDFGAVDIGWNVHYQQPCVFEVNTAPGIEGTTLLNYQRAIERLL